MGLWFVQSGANVPEVLDSSGVSLVAGWVQGSGEARSNLWNPCDLVRVAGERGGDQAAYLGSAGHHLLRKCCACLICDRAYY
jgi:hypothetical protein